MKERGIYEKKTEKAKQGYKLVWQDSLIFPDLESDDKISVTTSKAERGEILDRNGKMLAGKGVATSVSIIPGKLKDRNVSLEKIAELKATKEDTSGKEVGWFSMFTAEENVDKPILLISMVENVKGIGGSGYVVRKDATVLDEYFKE